jgi:D-alanyl-D-alanine carboxypeptidase (penicillin-binding protein 5/6)
MTAPDTAPVLFCAVLFLGREEYGFMRLFLGEKMKKIRSLILLLIVFIQAVVPMYPAAAETDSVEPAASELYARSAVLMDGDSGRVLYEKNGQEAMANASTTKIMTCIVALENCNLDSEVEVSSLAASQPKVHLGMQSGQHFYLKDLLYGLMLESYNDCAVAIAEYVAGTTEGFAAFMNDKAAEIGCEDTYFITPNGLDATDENGFHHTTATDLARIMRYCISLSPKAEEFLAITRTAQYSFSDVEGSNAYSCYNHNSFLQMMDGALSGKTGFTGNAGYCYVGALKRDDRTYIVALLACGWPNNKTYKWADTKKLMNYGLDAFVKKSLADIAIDESRLSPVFVEGGQTDTIGGEKSVRLRVVEDGMKNQEILLKEDEEITLEYEIAGKLYAPVKEGDYLGKITYYLGDEILCECRVEAADTVEKIDFFWCLKRVEELLFL